MKCIRLSGAEDGHAITRLRQEAFLRSSDFRVVHSENLNWGPADVRGMVLSVWNEHTPLSTTRGDVFKEAEEAEESMECRLNRQYGFPSLLLGKGATVQSLERMGFHSALRYCFIRAAMQTSVESILGIVYEGAPRTRLMKEIGYDFYSPADFRCTNLEYAGKAVLVATLPRARFACACKLLEAVVRPILEEYQPSHDMGSILAQALNSSQFEEAT